MFQKADANDNGVLTFTECQRLIEQLNVKMEEDELARRFREANMVKAKRGSSEEEALDETEFLSFYYSLLRRPELDRIFLAYAQYKTTPAKMTAGDLATFLFKEQKARWVTF